MLTALRKKHKKARKCLRQAVRFGADATGQLGIATAAIRRLAYRRPHNGLGKLLLGR